MSDAGTAPVASGSGSGSSLRQAGRQRIGNYYLGPEIGRGSFATVYKGNRAKTHQAIAIKAVSRQKLTAKLLENLESEINILKAISHRNIVSLEDCFKSDTHIYLVMEYCTGSDLSIYIKNRGKIPTLDFEPRPNMFMFHNPPPPISESDPSKVYWPHPTTGGIDERLTRSFLGQLAQALIFLRSQDLIHRDIKPQNLLLHPANAAELAEGHPLGIPILKVADFGFARILPAAAMAETLCGSPLYMAPEILRYEKYDAKADLWSVGAVLYEMAVGKSPFRANNHVELLKRIEKNADRIKFPDESPRAEGADDKEPPIPVSDDLKALIRGLLKRRPADRMGFDEFFASKVWETQLESSEESLSPDIVSTDSSDILASKVKELVMSAGLEKEPERGRRRESTVTAAAGPAPGTATHTHAPSAPQPISVDPALNPAPAPTPRARPIPPFAVAPLPTAARPTPITRRTEPKYYVGDEKLPDVSPAHVIRPSMVPTQSSPGNMPTSSRSRSGSTATNTVAVPSEPTTTGLGINTNPRPITRDRRYSGKEAASLEEPAPLTPSSSNNPPPILRPRVAEGSPLAATPPITMSSGARGGHVGDTGKDKSAIDESDSVVGREYVVVEKQTVEVNALADELDQASRANTALVRRPSSRTSVVSRPVSAYKPPQATNTPGDRASIRPLSYSPPFGMSTTPPFAVNPSSLRRPSGGAAGISRPPSVPQQGIFPPVSLPSRSPDPGMAGAHGITRFSAPTGGTSPSSLQTGALARALTNTAIRIIGQGANTAAHALARAAQRRRPDIPRTGEMNEAEETLLRSVEDVARKAFALFELGDDRLGVWHTLQRTSTSAGNRTPPASTYNMVVPASGSGGRRKSSSSSVSTSANASPHVNADIAILRQQEQAAGEAVVLYCKALNFIVQGTNRIQEYWEVRETGPTSIELNEMVQWLRARFNECYEKAEYAKVRCAEDLPFVDRLMHDKARDHSRNAALAEMQGEFATAELGYETAIWLLMALLDDVMYDGTGSRLRDEDRTSVEKMLVPIRIRLEALRRKAPQSPA